MFILHQRDCRQMSLASESAVSLNHLMSLFIHALQKKRQSPPTPSLSLPHSDKLGHKPRHTEKENSLTTAVMTQWQSLQRPYALKRLQNTSFPSHTKYCKLWKSIFNIQYSTVKLLGSKKFNHCNWLLLPPVVLVGVGGMHLYTVLEFSRISDV